MALSTKPLLGWSFACALTNLLDEVLVAFSATHLHAVGSSASERSWAIGAWVMGNFLGLWALERYADRLGPRRAMRGLAGMAVLSVLALSVTRSPILAMGLSPSSVWRWRRSG